MCVVDDGVAPSRAILEPVAAMGFSCGPAENTRERYTSGASPRGIMAAPPSANVARHNGHGAGQSRPGSFFKTPGGGACPPTQTFWDLPGGGHPESISQPFPFLSPKHFPAAPGRWGPHDPPGGFGLPPLPPRGSKIKKKRSLVWALRATPA
jgi:hypothetical protein